MRIRTVKPEFWENEDLSSVSPEAVLLAVGLLNYSDDDGYFKAHPRLIQSAIFPLRECSVSIPSLILELSNIGYIEIMEGSDGKRYGRVCKFLMHQRINRPTPSKIKDLVDGAPVISEQSVSNQGGLTAGMEWNGMERKGREERSPLDGFDQFWSAYPKKAAKKDAKKAWGQIQKDRPPLDTLLEAIRRQSKGRQWQEGIYPNAATWLRGERWNDEPEKGVGGATVGRPQPKQFAPNADDGPGATPEERAAALKQIRDKLGMDPFEGGE